MTGLLLRQATLGFALGHADLGVREEGGQNAGPVVRKYLANCDPPIGVPAAWCAAFVQYAPDSVAKALDVANPLDGVSREAYVQDYFTWAEERGLFVPTPEPGDLVLFRFPSGPNRWNHIGIVASPIAQDGTFWTVEGNTSPGVGSTPSERDREGDGVYFKDRSVRGGYPVRFVRWA